MKAEQITMLEIDKTLVSLDIIEKQFCCNLEKCHGACCVIGESGAPLEEEEKVPLADAYPIARRYMTSQGVESVENQGWYIVDNDGDTVTPLMEGGACAYSYNKKGTTYCAIEKAWFNGLVDFRKPVSCHLYPVRITKYEAYDAINYEKNEICKSALKSGKKQHIYLYQFLKDPLIRKYGIQWYNQLEKHAAIWQQQMSNTAGQ